MLIEYLFLFLLNLLFYNGLEFYLLFPLLCSILLNAFCNCSRLKQLFLAFSAKHVYVSSDERFHYVEPQHGRKFIESLWEIGTAVENHNVMEITYCRTHDGETRVRTIEPVGILFSEYYFYLAAFIEGIDKDKHFQNPQDNSPTIYRIDRIQNYKTFDRHFAQRYTDRFQEGEMRKRIQFMYGGELQTIRFEYTGPSLESVLDRLPTAKVLQVTEKGWIVEAEVFGTGIQMWVRSQGDFIKVL